MTAKPMEKERAYYEVAFPVAGTDLDAVSNYIIENIATGLLFEEEEGQASTIIKFYLPTDNDPDEKLAGLKQYLRAVDDRYQNTAFTTRKIKDLDWIDSYRRSVVPLHVGDNIVIKPPWCTDSFADRVEIIIEPKMAFGTGRHETTRSCLVALEKIDLSNKTVLDLGCGSGILGIFAAKRGAVDILACDVDPLAVENSRDNFILNGVADRCRVRAGSAESIPSGRPFDVVVVNIIKETILPIMAKLKDSVSPGGYLILSGLLIKDKPELESMLIRQGLNRFTTIIDGDWITYTVLV